MKRAELDRRIANGETLEDIVPVLMDDGADITSYDDLKRFAIEKIESDELYLAEHVLKACLDVADYYGYDYSMGTLENPTAIDGVEDLIDYVEDWDGGSTGHPGGCPFSLLVYAGYMECTVHLLAGMPVCYICRQQGGR